jgi:hypothetical protein
VRNDVHQALAIDASSTMEDRTIDITTPDRGQFLGERTNEIAYASSTCRPTSAVA